MYCLVPTAPLGSISSCALANCNASMPSNDVTVWANEADHKDSSRNSVKIPDLCIGCIFLRTTRVHLGGEVAKSQAENFCPIEVCEPPQSFLISNDHTRSVKKCIDNIGAFLLI